MNETEEKSFFDIVVAEAYGDKDFIKIVTDAECYVKTYMIDAGLFDRFTWQEIKVIAICVAEATAEGHIAGENGKPLRDSLEDIV